MVVMTCPICKRDFDKSAATARPPFCSERCKLIDLGRWLNGSYQIPVTAADEDEAPPASDNFDPDD